MSNEKDTMNNETETIIKPVVVEMPDKPYVLRSLQAQDLFLLTRVVGSMDIKKLANVFNEKVDISAIASDETTNEDAVRELGYGTLIEIVGIVIDELPNCQEPLFKFLAAISNLTEEQVKTLPLADFIDMVTDVVKLKEFRDFFTRAARLMQ